MGNKVQDPDDDRADHQTHNRRSGGKDQPSGQRAYRGVAAQCDAASTQTGTGVR
jgi:hypothetical protein